MQQRVHRVVLVSVDGVYGDARGVALAGLGASVDVHIDRCANLLGGSPEGFVPFVAVGQSLRRCDPDVDTPQPGLDESRISAMAFSTFQSETMPSPQYR